MEAQETQDALSKEQRLQALQSELNQSIESIEGEFAKKCAKLCEEQPELEELFFEDKEKFFLKILEYQNKVFTQEITNKQDQISNLESEISFDNKMADLQSAEAEFKAQNPQVDTKELLAFFANLPEDIKAQIEALPAEEVFPTLLALSQEQERESNENAEDLPAQVNGSPAGVSTNDTESNLPTQRY